MCRKRVARLALLLFAVCFSGYSIAETLCLSSFSAVDEIPANSKGFFLSPSPKIVADVETDQEPSVLPTVGSSASTQSVSDGLASSVREGYSAPTAFENGPSSDSDTAEVLGVAEDREEDNLVTSAALVDRDQLNKVQKSRSKDARLRESLERKRLSATANGVAEPCEMHPGSLERRDCASGGTINVQQVKAGHNSDEQGDLTPKKQLTSERDDHRSSSPPGAPKKLYSSLARCSIKSPDRLGADADIFDHDVNELRAEVDVSPTLLAPERPSGMSRLFVSGGSPGRDAAIFGHDVNFLRCNEADTVTPQAARNSLYAAAESSGLSPSAEQYHADGRRIPGGIARDAAPFPHEIASLREPARSQSEESPCYVEMPAYPNRAVVRLPPASPAGRRKSLPPGRTVREALQQELRERRERDRIEVEQRRRALGTSSTGSSKKSRPLARRASTGNVCGALAGSSGQNAGALLKQRSSLSQSAVASTSTKPLSAHRRDVKNKRENSSDGVDAKGVQVGTSSTSAAAPSVAGSGCASRKAAVIATKLNRLSELRNARTGRELSSVEVAEEKPGP